MAVGTEIHICQIWIATCSFQVTRWLCLEGLGKRGNLWRESLQASEHIMSIVSAGYRLRLPTPSFLENHSMSYDDRSYAAEAIKELVDNCYISRVDRQASLSM